MTDMTGVLRSVSIHAYAEQIERIGWVPHIERDTVDRAILCGYASGRVREKGNTNDPNAVITVGNSNSERVKR